MGKMEYKAPRALVIEVKAYGVLCASPYGDNTEKFTLGAYSYDESDWE